MGDSERHETRIFPIEVSNYCVKRIEIQSYHWSVFSCIRTDYTKIRTRNNSVFGHFLRSGINSIFVYIELGVTKFYIF